MSFRNLDHSYFRNLALYFINSVAFVQLQLIFDVAEQVGQTDVECEPYWINVL